MIHNKSYQYTDMQKEYDVAIYDPPFDMWKDLVLVTKAKYHVCFTDELYRHDTEALFGKPDFVIVWHFNNGDYRGDNMPNNCHEYIFIYGDIDKRSNAGSFHHNTKPQYKGRRQHTASGEINLYYPKEQRQVTTVINSPRTLKNGGHIWCKPQYIVVQLLQWLSEPGDKIWDGFAGTGNVGIVSKKLECEYEGYETDKSKYKKAVDRIENTTCESRKAEILKIHIEHEDRKRRNLKTTMRGIDKAILLMKEKLDKERSETK